MVSTLFYKTTQGAGSWNYIATSTIFWRFTAVNIYLWDVHFYLSGHLHQNQDQYLNISDMVSLHGINKWLSLLCIRMFFIWTTKSFQEKQLRSCWNLVIGILFLSKDFLNHLPNLFQRGAWTHAYFKQFKYNQFYSVPLVIESARSQFLQLIIWRWTSSPH